METFIYDYFLKVQCLFACSVKVFGFFSVNGIQITDLLTSITDYDSASIKG